MEQAEFDEAREAVEKGTCTTKVKIVIEGTRGTTWDKRMCEIVSEDATWLLFKDEFNNLIKYNKNFIRCIERETPETMQNIYKTILEKK